MAADGLPDCAQLNFVRSRLDAKKTPTPKPTVAAVANRNREKPDMIFLAVVCENGLQSTGR
jgi:hypothetical protein